MDNKNAPEIKIAPETIEALKGVQLQPNIGSINADKPIEEATKDAAQTEMSAEEQQAILEQIIQDSKRRSSMGFFKKPGKMVSKNAEKKRKSKNKQAKASRKANRKKKK
jgi:hypothetical protein